ncbi:16S rRNA (guanine(527)-N(7))-methyltransferase RsmG [Pseudoroseomonas rhizosphaerae]|uniref:Ribosomal RNA small subunit methyltransferase G n=1 Tax=Teichococcus rhizosphaerae TaxID=1335062 RepID=A0A2C7A9W0_9PROT|nr:16S rRNA (guanine(527)-N(7))-methyltransferase RsmG [Pseudoroseomonas rhizosphaerae]PHK94809.1 16S rRNA (guanine(527)-N(7))-methyltransferase RsmG [Pseudoroseomonas rhizosphaerae]
MKQPLFESLPEPGVSRETEARLEAFLPLLLRWNARINLVASQDPAVLRQRHIADSLQLLPLLPAGEGAMADLGSGGGFPGLVLAMAVSRPVHLVESDRRKAAFLQAAAAELGLSHVVVHPVRIEAVRLPPLAALTARALAPLEKMLPWASALLAPDGVAIFPKGQGAEAEIAGAIGAGWTMSLQRFKSSTDPNATILRMSGIHCAGE